jgi:hypothetical protein
MRRQELATQMFGLSSNNAFPGYLRTYYMDNVAPAYHVYTQGRYVRGRFNFIGNDLSEVVGTTIMKTYPIVFPLVSTDVRGFKDGIEQPNTGINASGTGSYTADFDTIGKIAASGFAKGNHAEIIFYNRILTAGELTQINDYLSLKYGTLT